MADFEELWGTETGLPDDFELTITEAAFEYDERYMNGEIPLLVWRGYTGNDPADVINPPIKFATGSGWTVAEGGRRVVSDTGKTKFHRSSWVGRLVDRVMSFPEAKAFLVKRGAPTDASVWVGTRWHMKREVVNYGGSIGEREHLMPVKFLGVVEVTAAPATSATPAAAAAAAPAASGMDETMIALARTCTTFEEFKQKAVQVPGALQNPVVLQNILSESGYWARR